MVLLNGAQRRILRGKANTLDPVIHVGKSGLTAGIVIAIETALDDHELIKVRFLDYDREERKALSEKIVKRVSAALVGAIGNTAVYYRPSPLPEKRTIKV